VDQRHVALAGRDQRRQIGRRPMQTPAPAPDEQLDVAGTLRRPGGRQAVVGVGASRSLPAARRTSSCHRASAASPRRRCSSGVMSGASPDTDARRLFVCTMTGAIVFPSVGTRAASARLSLPALPFPPTGRVAIADFNCPAVGSGSGAARLSLPGFGFPAVGSETRTTCGPSIATAFRFRGGRLGR